MSRRYTLAMLLGILGAALLLRLHALTAGSIWLDEAYTVVLARHSVADILRLAPTDANPPFASLVYRMWSLLFGDGELSWELPAAILGVAAVAGIFLFGRQLHSAKAGLFAALLLATSTLHITYSQQIRSYALAIVLSIATAYFMQRWLERWRRLDAALTIVFGLLFLATHYYALLVLGAFGAAAIVSAFPKRELLARVFGAGALFLALAAPLLRMLYLQYTRYYSFAWIPPPDAAAAVGLFTELSWGSLPILGILAGLAAFGALHNRHRADSRATARLLLFWLLLPAAIAVTTSLAGRPFVHQRYAVLWLVPLVLLAGNGLAAIPRRPLALAIAGLLVVLTAPQLVDYYHGRRSTRRDEELFAVVALQRRHGDVIVHFSKQTFVPALVYHRFAGGEFLLQGAASSNVMKYWMADRTSQIGVASIATHRRLWIVRHSSVPAGAVRQLLDQPQMRTPGWHLAARGFDDELLLFVRATPR